MGLDVTDVGLEKSSKKHEIKKHAATIHCSNTLSLLQRKISNALLYHAYHEMQSREEHEISIKQLCRLIGYSGNNHAVIKDGLKGLLSTVIEWNVVNDTTGLEDWTASSILASVCLRGPLCIFAYSPRMKQLLHSPSMFGKIDLFIQSHFKSSYGLALYENCIRYRGLPYTKWFEMDVFRKLMGVPPGKYTIFRDFKRRVLDKSIEEVNSYSDLYVEAEIQKEGRQVVKLRFSLKERAKKTRLGSQTPQLDSADSELSQQAQLINQFGLSEEQALQVITDYEASFIQEKILLIETSKNYQEGRVHNLAGYLLSALKNNYQAGKSSVLTLKEQKVQKAQDEMHTKKIKRAIDVIRSDYLAYREQLIDDAISRLSAETHFQLLTEFRMHAAESINTVLRLQRNKYTPETVIESPQIKALLRQFAIQCSPLLAEQVLPFEKFLLTLPEEQQEAWHESQMVETEVEK